MLEVEVKLRLDDPGPVRRRLAALRATDLGTVQQEDTFFLRSGQPPGGEALRVRRAGDLLELTWKGPRRPGVGAKAREEESVPVGADPTRLLGRLGFEAGLRVRKLRHAFRLGKVEVALDEVEGLGRFLEVEAQAEDAAAGAALVRDALALLGLEDAPHEPRSYAELLAPGRAG